MPPNAKWVKEIRSLKAPYGIVEKLFLCKDSILSLFRDDRVVSAIHSSWLKLRIRAVSCVQLLKIFWGKVTKRLLLKSSLLRLVRDPISDVRCVILFLSKYSSVVSWGIPEGTLLRDWLLHLTTVPVHVQLGGQ